MQDEHIWTLYFAGVASIRFHPRNLPNNHLEELAEAAQIADEMLYQHRIRYPCQLQQHSSEAERASSEA